MFVVVGGEEAAVTDAQLLPTYSKFLTVKNDAF